MLGNLGKTEWFPLGIENLTPLGKKVSSSLRICRSKFYSAGDCEFEVLTLMGILKFSSAGDMYFKVLTPLGDLDDVLQGISLGIA